MLESLKWPVCVCAKTAPDDQLMLPAACQVGHLIGRASFRVTSNGREHFAID